MNRPRRLVPAAFVVACASLAVLGACRSRRYYQPTDMQPMVPPAPASFEAQAARGGGIYGASCARCHGASGQGGQGPALVGPGALPTQPPAGRKFRTMAFRTAADIHAFVAANMPPGGPKHTADEAYCVVAFALKANGVTLAKPLDAASAPTVPIAR